MVVCTEGKKYLQNVAANNITASTNIDHNHLFICAVYPFALEMDIWKTTRRNL